MIRLWLFKRLRVALKRLWQWKIPFFCLAIGLAGSVAYQKKWVSVAEARIPEPIGADFDQPTNWRSLLLSSDLSADLPYPFNSGFRSGYNDSFNIGSRFTQAQMISQFCERLAQAYKKYGWRDCPCSELNWTFAYRSEMGHPLLYWEYVDEEAARGSTSRLQTTLILGGVHPDELTPIHLAFEFAKALHEEPWRYKNSRVIVAPLVNPDGFFSTPLRRTNINGVDLNRNFATADWWRRAAKNWAELRKRDPRHFPGEAPNTEQGTRFQSDLMARYEPDKVLTIHAPLGFLDYDGPGESGNGKAMTTNDIKAFELAEMISKRSNNYRIMNYTIYPGSLGNYAGNDRRIPTITVELESTDPRKALAFKRAFFPGLFAAVRYEFQRDLILVSQGEALDQKSSHGEAGNSASPSENESGKF